MEPGRHGHYPAFPGQHQVDAGSISALVASQCCPGIEHCRCLFQYVGMPAGRCQPGQGSKVRGASRTEQAMDQARIPDMPGWSPDCPARTAHTRQAGNPAHYTGTFHAFHPTADRGSAGSQHSGQTILVGRAISAFGKAGEQAGQTCWGIRQTPGPEAFTAHTGDEILPHCQGSTVAAGRIDLGVSSSKPVGAHRASSDFGQGQRRQAHVGNDSACRCWYCCPCPLQEGSSHQNKVGQAPWRSSWLRWRHCCRPCLLSQVLDYQNLFKHPDFVHGRPVQYDRPGRRYGQRLGHEAPAFKASCPGQNGTGAGRCGKLPGHGGLATARRSIH